tara:strand:- start:3275 stop:7714 length:4440 start_codon:yes stop_codon:yes gene_type:complete
MANDDNTYEPSIRRRGTTSRNIRAANVGGDVELSAGDRSWGRTHYSVKSNSISENSQEDIAEKLRILQAVIKECAPIVTVEMEKFAEVWNGLFSAEAGFMFPLVQALISEQNKFSYDLGAALGQQVQPPSATGVGLSQLGVEKRSSTWDGPSINSEEGAALDAAAAVDDTAMGLKVLVEKLGPQLGDVYFSAEDFEPFLAGTGVTEADLKTFNDRLLKVRYLLTEIEFGDLHAGGLKDVKNVLDGVAQGQFNTYNDTTPPFVAHDEERAAGRNTATYGETMTRNYEGELTLVEHAWDHSGASATVDEYGNVVLTGAELRPDHGEATYVYPRVSNIHRGDATAPIHVNGYYWSAMYWGANLAAARRTYQAPYRHSRADADEAREAARQWENTQGGGRNEWEESKRVTLGWLIPRVQRFQGVLFADPDLLVPPHQNVDWLSWLQGNDLSEYSPGHAPLADGYSIGAGVEQIMLGLQELDAARNAMEDCIYKMWDMCDRVLKSFADANEAAETHYVVGDMWQTAFNYDEEDRARYQEQMDETAGSLGRALDEVFLDAEKLIYREQCFLLSYIQQIASWKKENRDMAVPTLTATGNAVVQAAGAAGALGAGPAAAAALAKTVVSARGFKRLPYQPTLLNPDKTNANASLLLDGDPYGFLNKLIQTPHQQCLFDLENHQLSSLQPMIRLFKIEYDDEGNEHQYEIHFDSNANNIQGALQNKRQRGFGVGIKSFNFTYEGTNPFAVKKSIKAQLNIFANTFTELFTQRGPYRYVDLALKTGGAVGGDEDCSGTGAQNTQTFTQLQNENLSKLNFRLKAVVGWAPQGQTIGSGGVLGSCVRNALYESYATLELTPTVHHFDFDEMGRVNFTINYLAYVEDYFDDSAFNIFTHPDLAEARLSRELEIDYFATRCDAGQMGLLKESYADNIRSERSYGLSHLINTIVRSKKLYYIKLPYTDIRRFITKGPFAEYEDSLDFGNLIKDYGDEAALRSSIRESLSTFKQLITPPDDPTAEKADESNLISAALISGLDSESESLPFIFVSELIDIVLANIEIELKAQEGALARTIAGKGPAIRHRATGVRAETTVLATDANRLENMADQKAFDKCRQLIELKKVKSNIQQFKKMRVLLGPVEFVNPGAGASSIFVNLGDVPLSMRYFMEWISEKMLNKEQSIYSFTKFLNDLFNNIVKNFLNNDTCFSYSIAQKTRVNQAVVTSYPGSPNPQVDEITKYINSITVPGVREPKRAHINGLYSRGAPVLRTSGIPGTPIPQRSVSEEMNYFVYFAGRTAPTEFMKGNKAQDAERGIFHYLLGRDRGMIKNISLSKTDSKGLAEVRFEQDGYDGLKQLRVVYDVLIDTYADVKTYPGTYIFVNPQGFDPNSSLIACHESNLTQYGIGGYFMVWKSEHSFGAGEASTKIHAKWVNQVESEDCTIQSRGDEEEEIDGANCGSARVERFRISERERLMEENDLSMEEADEQLEQQYPT